MNANEAQLQVKVQALEGELSRLRQENCLLRQKVDLLSRKIFGCSSEKLSPGQLQLLLELADAKEGPFPESSEDPQPETKAKSFRKARKPRLPDKASLDPMRSARSAIGCRHCLPLHRAGSDGTTRL